MRVAPSLRSGGATVSVPRCTIKWKAKYGGLEASDIKRLKELERENDRLKRMYADLSLENAALKDVIAKKL
jgi:putative transposase